MRGSVYACASCNCMRVYVLTYVRARIFVHGEHLRAHIQYVTAKIHQPCKYTSKCGAWWWCTRGAGETHPRSAREEVLLVRRAASKAHTRQNPMLGRNRMRSATTNPSSTTNPLAGKKGATIKVMDTRRADRNPAVSFESRPYRPRDS